MQEHVIDKINEELLENNEEDEVYEEQIRKINTLSRARCLILPESDTRTVIDTISFLLLLFITLYVPFLISFNVETPDSFQYYEFFQDIWFLVEILINFFTGYYEKGVLVMNYR